MRVTLTQHSEWSPAKAIPAISTIVLSVLTVLPLRIPDYAAVVPLLSLAAVYYWTLYRPDWLPPTAVFACGIVFDLLSGAPLGVTSLVLLLARTLVFSQRRYFVNRLFPFVWSGFTLLAAAAIGALWLIGSALEGAVLDLRAAVLQWVLTVVSFPAASYLLMRVQRSLLPAD